ncbi:MAG: SapC family protein [Pikeienuella sp.]
MNETKTHTAPLGYTSLTPLIAERHRDITYAAGGGYGFARHINAVPLLAEEFGLAQACYPILFPHAAPHLPLALLGARRGVNDFVGDDGRWRADTYIPAYLRRYPFMLASTAAHPDRRLLCADLAAEGFGGGAEAASLFEADGTPSPAAAKILDFCQRYDAAELRTRATVQQFADLGVLEPGAVTVKRGEETLRVDGFQVISQKRLFALDDETLAGFTRRGVLPLIAAHLFSTTQFSDLFREVSA